MAEINFIFSREDNIEFSSCLLKEFDASFVVDDNFPQVTEVRNLQSLNPVLIHEYPPLVFVLSPLWSKLPLYKDQIIHQYKGKINYIMQRYGGPSFTWMLGNRFKKDNKQFISVGMLGDYSFYYVQPGNSNIIRRPAEMNEAFRATQHKIKSMCQGTRLIYKQTNSSGPWISQNVLALIEDGKVQLANDKLDIKK